jgi:uroporphyrinogen decarboxylase
MSSTPILLKTLKGENTDRTPIWFMRQAGRILPNYLKIKEQYTFWQMMQNPKIAAEVTLMPVHDLGVDAAILFSDILVIPHALGMGLDFKDTGPVFEKPLAFRSNPVGDLHAQPELLHYIYDVIDEIIQTKPFDTPLIGFCGAPLTTLLFMLQGLGRKGDFPDAIKFIYENPKATKRLIEKIDELTVIYIEQQINHGVEVFQLFDTHAGLLPFDLYQELFMPSVRKIAQIVRDRSIPFIFFPKGIGVGIASITPADCDYLSIDWQTPLNTARQMVDKEIGLQGNVDPRLLYASESEITHRLQPILDFSKKHQNWVCNLGHGFMPGMEYEKAKFMSNYLRENLTKN